MSRLAAPESSSFLTQPVSYYVLCSKVVTINWSPNIDCIFFVFKDRYVLEDYDAKPTFSSFLPAVAGVYGKPVWSFYVNRGQGVASFGVKSKNYPILEFNAANKAYQVTPYIGFRTFIKGTREGEDFMVEPFSPKTTRNLDGDADESSLPKRVMFVGTNEFEIRDIDSANGLTTSVK